MKPFLPSCFRSVTRAVAAYPLLPVLGQEQQGKVWIGAYLQFNALLALLSCVCYALLLPKLAPRKAGAAEASTAEEARAMEAYRQRGEIRWLSQRQLTQVCLPRESSGVCLGGGTKHRAPTPHRV